MECDACGKDMCDECGGCTCAGNECTCGVVDIDTEDESDEL